MPTNRITYGQTAIAVSPSPSNQTNANNLTGLKRIQSASVDFSFAEQRYKQIGSDAFIGQIPIQNSNIGLDLSYFYSNGTNEAIIGLDVNSEQGSLLNYVQKQGQDRNYYILLGTGENQEANKTDENIDFKNQFNVMALGNVFLNSYNFSASIGSIPSISTSLSAYNVVVSQYNDITNGEVIPAINTSTTPAEPVLNQNYKLYPEVFKNTTNRDGNIHSTFSVGDIKLTLADVKQPGVQFTGTNPATSATIQSLDFGFEISREDLYGLGSMYPYGRRAQLPVLGSLSFSALATDLTSGNLDAFLTGDHQYDFMFDLVDHCSGLTGLRIYVDQAHMTSESLSSNIGSDAKVNIEFDFSISTQSGLRFGTPPLIVNQPATTASVGDTLYVQPTGKTSKGGAYNADGFKYQWCGGTSGNIGSNQRSYVATVADSYYVVVSNELGSATSNTCVVS